MSIVGKLIASQKVQKVNPNNTYAELYIIENNGMIPFNKKLQSVLGHV